MCQILLVNIRNTKLNMRDVVSSCRVSNLAGNISIDQGLREWRVIGRGNARALGKLMVGRSQGSLGSRQFGVTGFLRDVPFKPNYGGEVRVRQAKEWCVCA